MRQWLVLCCCVALWLHAIMRVVWGQPPGWFGNSADPATIQEDVGARGKSIAGCDGLGLSSFTPPNADSLNAPRFGESLADGFVAPTRLARFAEKSVSTANGAAAHAAHAVARAAARAATRAPVLTDAHDTDWHFAMMHDTQRNDMFKRWLEHAISHDGGQVLPCPRLEHRGQPRLRGAGDAHAVQLPLQPRALLRGVRERLHRAGVRHHHLDKLLNTQRRTATWSVLVRKPFEQLQCRSSLRILFTRQRRQPQQL